MSCIVAIKKKGNVYMACDSCTTTEGGLIVNSSNKIIDIDNKMLISSVGDVLIRNCFERNIDRLKHFVDNQEGNLSDAYYIMVTFIIPSIKRLLKQEDLFHNRESTYPHIDATLLIAYRGRMFLISDDLSVVEPTDDFSSIGSGEKYAKGSIFSMIDLSDDISNILDTALKSAQYYCRGVREPFINTNLIKQ